jgi:hypothetical protein
VAAGKIGGQGALHLARQGVEGLVVGLRTGGVTDNNGLALDPTKPLIERQGDLELWALQMGVQSGL